MGEPEVYLEKLSAFSRILRLEGLSVSPKETEDASRLLILLGLEDRERAKTALRTVYAKTREACEKKLMVLIGQMDQEILAQKARMREQTE